MIQDAGEISLFSLSKVRESVTLLLVSSGISFSLVFAIHITQTGLFRECIFYAWAIKTQFLRIRKINLMLEIKLSCKKDKI